MNHRDGYTDPVADSHLCSPKFSPQFDGELFESRDEAPPIWYCKLRELYHQLEDKTAAVSEVAEAAVVGAAAAFVTVGVGTGTGIEAVVGVAMGQSVEKDWVG